MKPNPVKTAADYAATFIEEELERITASSPIMKEYYLDESLPVIEDHAELDREVQALMSIQNPQTRLVRAIAATELIKEAVLNASE